MPGNLVKSIVVRGGQEGLEPVVNGGAGYDLASQRYARILLRLFKEIGDEVEAINGQKLAMQIVQFSDDKTDRC
jgi:hypothetical protein